MIDLHTNFYYKQWIWFLFSHIWFITGNVDFMFQNIYDYFTIIKKKNQFFHRTPFPPPPKKMIEM